MKYARISHDGNRDEIKECEHDMPDCAQCYYRNKGECAFDDEVSCIVYDCPVHTPKECKDSCLHHVKGKTHYHNDGCGCPKHNDIPKERELWKGLLCYNEKCRAHELLNCPMCSHEPNSCDGCKKLEVDTPKECDNCKPAPGKIIRSADLKHCDDCGRKIGVNNTPKECEHCYHDGICAKCLKHKNALNDES